MYVIQIVMMANGSKSELEGQFVQEYYPEAFNGRGDLLTTLDREQALKFDTYLEALSCWKQTSKKNPVRPDGRPNRPMTAFTVEIIPI